MRRDMDLIRHLLFKIEELGSDHNGWIDRIEIPEYSAVQITHHLWLLQQAGLIEAEDTSTMSGTQIIARCLTWQGHELLAAIRDQEIWSQTKAAAKKGGSEALDLVWQVAKAYGRKKLQEVTGLPI